MGAPLRRRPDGRHATDVRYQIRPAVRADLPAVHAIEGGSFPDPWTVGNLAEALASAQVFFVAHENERVLGYVIARHVADEGEILNLAVATDVRRRGVGRALIAAALTSLRAGGAHAVHLEVRESNASARRLYQALGFETIGRRRAYYRRPDEDAVLLRAAIPAGGGNAIL